IMLSQVVQLIEQKQRFMITSHIRPDGDGLGSGLALYWMLRSLGKEADVVLHDRVPPAYHILPGSERVLVQPDIATNYDAAFIIECSDVEPAKISQALFYSYPFSKVNLLGLVLSGIERDESGRIGWVTMDRDMMYEAGACEEDADGIVNHALSVGEVEAVAFFKELAPG